MRPTHSERPLPALGTMSAIFLTRVAFPGRGAVRAFFLAPLMLPGLVLGLCGEHGGDPDSIKFVHDLGLDYVSCSPPRVEGARLAAAQAELAR